MSQYSKDLLPPPEQKAPNHLKVALFFMLVVLATFLLLFATSCSSKHIQKSSAKTDSVSVKKVDSSKTATKSVNRVVHKASAKVIRDLTKKKETVKEKTVIVFDDDTGAVVGKNGTAEDYLPKRKIKSITHTKTTTKEVDNNVTDSFTTLSNRKQSIDLLDVQKHIIQDSSAVKTETATSDKKVFRFSWWWLLVLLIPAGWWGYKKYWV